MSFLQKQLKMLTFLLRSLFVLLLLAVLATPPSMADTFTPPQVPTATFKPWQIQQVPENARQRITPQAPSTQSQGSAAQRRQAQRNQQARARALATRQAASKTPILVPNVRNGTTLNLGASGNNSAVVILPTVRDGTVLSR